MKIVNQDLKIVDDPYAEGRLSLRDDVRTLLRGEEVDSEIAKDLIREVAYWAKFGAGSRDERGLI